MRYILLSASMAFLIFVSAKPLKAIGSGGVAKEKEPLIHKEAFGETDGQKVYEYTLQNSNGMQVKVINYGGSISDIITPDRDGNMASVVLGFDTLEEYKGGKNALMGGNRRAVCQPDF